MIHDLNASPDYVNKTSAEVCIIGAGVAGIFLAKLLRQRGVAVTLIECGNTTSQTPAQKDEYCEKKGSNYRGAENGRAFGLGGTSSLWGGQMIPLSESDFSARPKISFPSWPVDYDDIARFFPVVSSMVGIHVNGSEDRKVAKVKFPFLSDFSENFGLRLSSWIPFGSRNFSIAFSRDLKTDKGLDVWLNAAVVEMCSQNGDGRVTEVVSKSPNGRELRVQPEYLVIAAGALESTRLLLSYDEAMDGIITRSGAPLGQFFADHLSMTCARFHCKNRIAFNKQVAPIFDRGIMRTPRLELSKHAQEKYHLSSAFSHFTFITHGHTGFDLVRSILRRLQGERGELDFKPSKLIKAVIDIFFMMVWRYLFKRLWIPRDAELLMQIDIEQLPNRNSRLHLSNERDSFGRKRLVVDWQVGARDIAIIKRVANLAIAGWKTSPLQTFADIQVMIPDDLDSLSNLYDVYHPTGTIRMGRRPSDSVIDRDLRLWASDNCYVTTTAVFPSSGSANPGMTHLALTARLAEHLAGRLRAL